MSDSRAVLGASLSSRAWSMHAQGWAHTVHLADMVAGGTPAPELAAREFADALTCLREALDLLVRDRAEVRMLSAAQRRRLAFPIVSNWRRWPSEGERCLSGVDAPARGRIHAVQPYCRNEHDRPRDPLLVLRDLHARAADPDLLWVEPVPEEPAPPVDPPVDPRVDPPGPARGTRLMVATPAGPAPALATLQALVVHVALVLTYVSGDRWGSLPGAAQVRALRPAS